MELAHEFRALVKSPAWARLVEVAGNQVKMRETSIAQPMSGLDDAVSRNVLIGERLGILLFVGLPETILESLEEQIEERKDGD